MAQWPTPEQEATCSQLRVDPDDRDAAIVFSGDVYVSVHKGTLRIDPDGNTEMLEGAAMPERGLTINESKAVGA